MSLDLTEGYLYDHIRLYSPPAPEDALQHVNNRSLWPSPEVAEGTIRSLFNPVDSGASYNDLISSLGHCKLCGKVMAIHLVLQHYCLEYAPASSSCTAAWSWRKARLRIYSIGRGIRTRKACSVRFRSGEAACESGSCRLRERLRI